MIDITGNTPSAGINVEEILRKQARKDPLENILNPAPEGLAETVAPGGDTASLSARSLEAARSLLAEVNAPKDYAEEMLSARRMDAQQAMDALAAEFNILDYVSEEMRDAVDEVRIKGALKKQEDVREASQKNINEMKEDIERAAEAATAPKDAEGNPIELPGGAGGTAPAADIPVAAQAVPAANAEVKINAPASEAAPEEPRRTAPKLNITI